MFRRIVLVGLLAAFPLAARAQEVQQEERIKVPKDSILVVVSGCVKGRVIRSADVRQTDTTSGFNVRATTFRLAGKKEVMAALKEQDGQHAEITGLIKKSSLIEPGMKFKGGRIMVGGGTTGAASGSMPSPAENVIVLDAMSVQGLGGSCEG